MDGGVADLQLRRRAFQQFGFPQVIEKGKRPGGTAVLRGLRQFSGAFALGIGFAEQAKTTERIREQSARGGVIRVQCHGPREQFPRGFQFAQREQC